MIFNVELEFVPFVVFDEQLNEVQLLPVQFFIVQFNYFSHFESEDRIHVVLQTFLVQFKPEHKVL